ncbi:hypothetical protein BDA96_02G189500 [Sorghum bicolor]|uniref:Uncharacterized protein n=1 Tax=Sorghum bicolor TaxID=4558 RepID=A0A921RMV4_SORBI|nr:hypothetical protein BDA96_02G189500 [Sorghum bicolor]KAG0543420.1 hypothetical protein BDA96_02G189500 [Sorghum bicolor]
MMQSIRTTGFKFQSRKRVFADQRTPRETRSKKNMVQRDASVTPSDICVPPPSRVNESHARELVGNLDHHAQAAIQDDNSAILDNTHMTTGFDAIDQDNQHNHMDNGDGFTQHDENTLVADAVDGSTQHGDQNHITNKGMERRERGNNMRLGLQKLNRARRGKLQVVIPEGNIRPLVPLVAAKYASECNIIVRNHVPILPHWKLYKNDPKSNSKEKDPKEKEPRDKEHGSAYVDLFLGKLKAKFDINTEDEAVKKACIEMMKSADRQQRYRLKQEYFDPFPLHLVPKTSPVKSMSNEQWLQLVESWKSPKKMEMCQKNKDNRANVKYHHTTGSRAYMVHVENLDNFEEPDAFDLFKEFHYSKKKNATPQLYRKLLLGWKMSYLQQQKVKNLSLQLKLFLMCLLRAPRRISSCRMWGSRTPRVDPVHGAPRHNWKRREGPMLSFVRRWLICQIKCKNLSRQGLWIERR